jgi:Fe-S cluster biogenesis protein NfuA
MTPPEELLERIERALATVRPALEADGGNIVVRTLRDNGILEVKWEGTCARCPLSVMTLRAGVERVLMKEVPEITRLEVVQS